MEKKKKQKQKQKKKKINGQKTQQLIQNKERNLNV